MRYLIENDLLGKDYFVKETSTLVKRKYDWGTTHELYLTKNNNWVKFSSNPIGGMSHWVNGLTKRQAQEFLREDVDTYEKYFTIEEI